jgi:hypothetical protein
LPFSFEKKFYRLRFRSCIEEAVFKNTFEGNNHDQDVWRKKPIIN